MRHSVIYNPFSVVVVPFPFVDSPKTKRRPTVVISSMNYQIQTDHLTLLMITSALHSPWFADYEITHLTAAGLHSKSIIRQKIFTIDKRLIIEKIGTLDQEDIKSLKQKFMQHIDLLSQFISPP